MSRKRIKRPANKSGDRLTHLPRQLERVPDFVPPPAAPGCVGAWRSRRFVVLDYGDRGGLRLLGVRRADELRMTWEQLQEAKEQAMPGTWAVEFYPPAEQTINSAHMRWLWVGVDAPPVALEEALLNPPLAGREGEP